MKKVIFLLVCLFVNLAVFAQSDRFSGSLLWKISGNGLEKPSYIFGTYHVLGHDFVDSIPGLKGAIEETDQAVGEIDMLDMMALQTKMMQAGMMPVDQGYKTLLSDEEYQTLDEGMKSIMGLGLDQMGMFKPGMINSSLAIFMYMKLDPAFNPATFVGIDNFLQKQAKDNNKPVVGLETVEDQIHVLFDSQPLDVQVKSLLCSIKNIDYGIEQLGGLTEDYKAGDLNALYALYDEPLNPCKEFSTKESKDALLKNRNDNWMTKLPQIMRKTPSLVAVGALHLAGEEGLLYQLDKLGYKVEPVK